MDLRDNILEFDKREISLNEVIEHMEFYIEQANECRNLFKTDRIKCKEKLKEINVLLEAENKYYRNIKCKNKYFNNYSQALYEARTKQKLHRYDIYKQISELKYYLNYWNDVLKNS